MFENSIDNKPLFKRPDGVELRDLTQTMFQMRSQNYVTYSLYKVPKEFAMRPDLISSSAYGNSTYTEIILKFNSISNPFSVAEGDVILIPNLESAQEIIKDGTRGEKTDVANRIRNSYKYIDPKKAPKKSDQLQSFDKRKLREGALPPNFAEEGASQVTFRDGRVYFNGNNEACLRNGMSSSEFLTNVIKSKTPR